MVVALSFGTAGIRAPLGPGEDALNLRTVRVVAHALVDYLAVSVPDARGRGLCVGFDGRRESDAFAREVSRVALAQGFVVRAFAETAPTPLLAFCTRVHGAAAGVMITASHNPPEDNGIKIYWQGGAQIVSPHDREIATRIGDGRDPDAIPLADLDEARSRGRLCTLGRAEEDLYLASVAKLSDTASALPLPRIAYSALCGVGGPLARRVFALSGAHDVVEVESQRLPLPDFGGLSAPNPELRPALRELLSVASRSDAQVAFAHDPDADRIAVIARDDAGELRVLSGDEVGALLGAHMLEHSPEPPRQLLVSTLVSSELLGDIAAAQGARYEQTLTGFKWIASRARAIEHETGLSFLFGYEEAIGYAFGALGDDKDGVAALYVLLALIRELGTRGETLFQRLTSLWRQHGLYASRQITVSAKGQAGRAQVAGIVASLRKLAPEELLGEAASVVDYLTQTERADLLIFRGRNTRICVRPSGTEPKLKLYLHARSEVSSHEPIEQAEARAQALLDQLEQRVQTFAS